MSLVWQQWAFLVFAVLEVLFAPWAWSASRTGR